MSDDDSTRQSSAEEPDNRSSSPDEPLRRPNTRELRNSHIPKPPLEPSNSKESKDSQAAQDSKSMDPNSDMINMFASVWVKVEVQDESDHSDQELNDPTYNYEEEKNANPFPEKSRTRKKRPKQFTKTFKCDRCAYVTVYKNCLTLHARGHDEVKPFSCDECDYTTKYPTALHRHVTIRHKEKEIDPNNDPKAKKVRPFKCDQCDYSSYYKWNLNAHKRKHKTEKQFKCNQCPYETAYKHNYLKHSKVHNEGMFFKCDKCPFMTKFEGHITRHLAKIHKEVTETANKCDFCDFATKVKWRLNIHKQRSKQKDVLKCGYCEFQSFYTCEIKCHKVTHYKDIRTPSSLRYNLNTSLGSNEKLSDIHKSLTSFQVQANISFSNQHLNNLPTQDQFSHQSAESYNDQSLNFDSFNQNQDAQMKSENGRSREKNHGQYRLDPDCVDWNSIQVLESDDKERPFMCHMCNYTSKFKASVQRHFQRHHTGTHNRPYKCVNCDFSTKTKDQIALHNKRSQSETQLICTLCLFTTYYKCQFVMHQKLHYEYKCTICDYSCKHKYELQKHHFMLHLGNAFKCRFCEYKSIRKDAILSHETTHTGIKPFNCSFCDYSAVRKSLLDNHLKRYHGAQQSDVTVVSDSKIESLKTPILDKRTEALLTKDESREFIMQNVDLNVGTN